MVYLIPEEDCDCETCPGYFPPTPIEIASEEVIGGEQCACRCHKDEVFKKDKIAKRKAEIEEIARKLHRQ